MILKLGCCIGSDVWACASNRADDTNFVVAATVVPANDNLSGSGSGSFLSDGEFGSPFSWTEESSDEDLDYFVALDVAAAESSLRVEVG